MTAPAATNGTTGRCQRPLVWFRSDLRVRDNPALHAACTAATAGVTAAFLVSAEQWREHDWSPWKVDLLRRSLAELRAALAGRGIPLRIRTARRFRDAPQAILQLCRDEGCDAVFANAEVEVNERRRDRATVEACRAAGIPFHAFRDQLLLDPDVIRSGSGTPYTVYTPFSKACLRELMENGMPRLLGDPPDVPATKAAGDAVPEAIPGFPAPEGSAELHPAGEQAALKLLQDFAGQRIEGYRDQRDFPAMDGTSGLSPNLALGTISARRCLELARQQNRGRLTAGGAGPDTWIKELLWREFYRHIMLHFPRVGMGRPFLLETEAVRWRDDKKGFAAWCEGRTGYPIVDAGMRCLVATGWLHNRLRMVVAQFLTKDLLVDWRLGEKFFMQHLVDGDQCSNNGGWQWSASTGNDAAPWFRVFNPVLQSRKYDADGEFVRRWVPELADVEGAAIHDPPDELRPSLGYPARIVEHHAARDRALDAFRVARGDQRAGAAE